MEFQKKQQQCFPLSQVGIDSEYNWMDKWKRSDIERYICKVHSVERDEISVWEEKKNTNHLLSLNNEEIQK